ncbi:hypothetical protein GGR52DRAFT_573658 [Hypoxylon sp. FL1284]|nr:hypothetical protein GGR52DRAFT_573658 [Hypoxylon sp. FL1284]
MNMDRNLRSEGKLSLGKFLDRQNGYDYTPVDGAEQSEYGASTGIQATDTISRPVSKRPRWQNYLTCGSIWGLAILAVALLINLLLSIARSLWGIEDDPDKIFGTWGKPGTATEGLARYPTDFLRDVVPIRCHSHNDYWRKVPLFSAIHAGCIGVEADVWLMDDDQELYIGHDPAALTPERTFKSLYINPLVDLINQTNPQTRFYSGTRRGVFDYDPEQTLILLVDVKTDGAETWPHLMSQLEPLRLRGYLTHVKDGVVHKRQVTVVGTGNTPFDLVVKNSTYRDAFFDAPIADLWEDPDDPDSAPTEDAAKYDSTNSFYASASLIEVVGVGFGGFGEDQLRNLRGQIKGAHKRGLQVRYWETPSWPIGLRNKIWHSLMEEGADILNVDDLRSAAKLEF